VGLVVKLYDLLEVTGGHIYPSDGAAHYEARAAARAPPPAPARRARGAAERPACERGRGAGLAARTPAPDCRLRRRRLSACWFSARSKARCWSGGSRTRTRAPPPALRAFTLWCRGSVGVCACWRAGRDGWMQHSRAPVPALREAVRLPRARRQGLQVSLGFFDDVHVAPDFLPEPSMFEPGDKGAGEWFWQYDDNRMYLERNEPVRVRVREARRSVSPFPNPLRPSLPPPPAACARLGAAPAAALRPAGHSDHGHLHPRCMRVLHVWAGRRAPHGSLAAAAHPCPGWPGQIARRGAAAGSAAAQDACVQSGQPCLQGQEVPAASAAGAAA